MNAFLLLLSVLTAGPIDDANDALPGSTIVVPAGSYAGGTINNDVTLVADGDAVFTSTLTLKGEVTLDGFLFGNRNGQLIEVRASNCVIRNCEFSKFGKSGPSKAIWIREHERHDNTLIENCLFDNWSRSSSHSSCVKVSQDGGAQHQGTIIRNCLASNGADGGNSVAFQLFAPTLVEWNEIHHVEDAIEVKGDGSIIRGNHIHHNTGSEQLSNRDGSDNLFERNYVHDVSSWPAWIAEGSRVTFINNLFARCAHRGMRITGTVPSRYSGTSDILIAHNTFVDVDDALEHDTRQTELPRNLTIVNNIFLRGSHRLPPSMLTQANWNLYWQVVPSVFGPNDVIDDPLFANEAEDNFRLSLGSPAINSGVDAGVAEDWDGVARDAIPDIGAFEGEAIIDPILEALLRRRDELLAQIAELEIELATVEDEIIELQ